MENKVDEERYAASGPAPAGTWQAQREPRL